MAARKKLSNALEDYLEAILRLVSRDGVARSKKIADMLGVSRPSVTAALKQLSGRGLVSYEPYGYATLTDKGLAEAGRIERKHRVIESFFVDVLNLDRSAAQEAACKAEHVLGPEVISRLVEFHDFVNRTAPSGTGSIAEQFRNFQGNTRSGV